MQVNRNKTVIKCLGKHTSQFGFILCNITEWVGLRGKTGFGCMSSLPLLCCWDTAYTLNVGIDLSKKKKKEWTSPLVKKAFKELSEQ